jgi:hypothetical protein
VRRIPEGQDRSDQQPVKCGLYTDVYLALQADFGISSPF